MEILKKASDNVVNILISITPILDTGEIGIRNTALTPLSFYNIINGFKLIFFNTNDHKIK